MVLATAYTQYVLPAYARFGLAGVGVCFVPRYPARARLQQAPASFVALDTRPQAMGKRTYGTHGLHGKHGYMVAMVSNWLIGGVSASIGTCGYPLSVRASSCCAWPTLVELCEISNSVNLEKPRAVLRPSVELYL